MNSFSSGEPRPVRSGLACVAIALFVGLGCGWDYTPSDNILPEPAGNESSGTSDGPSLETGDTGEPGSPFPATYRFECIDIQSLGDADDTVFQVATLQNTWAADVAGFKLNILVDLLEADPDLGEGTMAIRSGVGAGWTDQCSQSETESAQVPAVYDATSTQWVPSSAEGRCAEMAQSGGGGTFTLDLGTEDRFYIYAEDNDGTAFNCSLDAARPDAIPISGVTATMTLSEDRSLLAGTLTGCMAEADALKTCSCLAVCTGAAHPDCGGCPDGAVPLGVLLGGVNSTPHCTDLLGAPAFDIVLEFSARRLGEVPMTCG